MVATRGDNVGINTRVKAPRHEYNMAQNNYAAYRSEAFRPK